MNGVPLSAHLGKTVAEVIPRVYPLVEPFIRRALAGEPVSGVEIQKPPDANGNAQTLMLSYQPVRDEAGEVDGVSVAIMDITRAKRIEEALRESENHYRHMIELSPHVPWVLNPKGEVTDASPRWESITGQKIEDALGNGWLAMLHPDDVAPILEAIQKCLGEKLPIDVEYRVRRTDGEWTWMRSRGAPRFGSSGEVIAVYGVVEEVHGHKQLTEELQDCEAELRAAANAVPIGLVLANANDGAIFMVNPAADEILKGAVFPGQKFSEYTRLPISDADGKPFSGDDFALVRAVLHGEAVGPLQVVYTPSDRPPVPLIVSSRPILSDGGELIGGLLMIHRAGSGA